MFFHRKPKHNPQRELRRLLRDVGHLAANMRFFMTAFEEVKAELDNLSVKLDAYIASNPGGSGSPTTAELLAFRDAIKAIVDRIPPVV